MCISVSDAANVVTAAATIATALIALLASKTWFETLKLQKRDECIAAAYRFSALIGRAVSFREKDLSERFWPAYDEAWDGWKTLERSYVVASRYYTNDRDDLDKKAIETLYKLHCFCNHNNNTILGK
jgi:hypothetical protein